ncbi:amidohydrolase family protein [Rhizorhabdus dicambivorans]|uniref:Amidohydrolase n=1 Tax=Rhizorhabdus dicambivorans TaxID=1850238 RepID=A0A2A4FZ13_9SPHN|nr:amidohydrolase family protein [Rhizorhabdus dicambivorans]ATE63613.1 amidohydrolase [Rhizorhabdus dicambivorans]PCE42739.1 amidohydrolase [Rhizorhabdus dicambivorans]
MRVWLIAVAALLAQAASAETTAIVGGTVAIGDGSTPIPDGTVVFTDGRVVAAGRNVAVPAGAKVIDARGKWVAAGIVAGFSDLGLADVDGVGESNDGSAAKSPFSAAIDVSPAINPHSAILNNERLRGVTSALVSPSASGSIFAGQGAVISLGVGLDPVMRPRAFQYVELGEYGAELAGGSRPAAFVMLHEALAEAQDYRRNPDLFDGRGKDSLIKRPDARALLAVLDGKVPLLVHVERASDIRSVLALKTDYPRLKLGLVGAGEGWMVAPEIAAARVPVIAAALADLPEAFERIAATQSNVGRMAKAGVAPLAISTINADPGANQGNLKQYAGNLVAITKVPGYTGLDWGRAFAAITSGPAAVVGMDSEIGSLRPGRRADLVIWTGDPLELSSVPIAIFIHGRQQPAYSRQTRLRDRYITPGEQSLPKAYQR